MNIPDYTLLQSCGKGAYGQVWLAQSKANKLVALKYIPCSQAFDREYDGIRNYSLLPESPYLIRILHLGKLDEGFFYTMELADGLYLNGQFVPETLAERIKQRKSLSPGEVIELAYAILNALDVIHEAKLVHRDIKPENILYFNGKPKLSDMGLIRHTDDTVSLCGTLGYIPPERLTPEGAALPYEKSDDLYALGKVLYCALSGNPVEKFPSCHEDMIHNTLCSHVNQVILKACSKREDRFQCVNDFRQAMQNGIMTDRITNSRASWKTILICALSFVLLILLTLGGLFLLAQRDKTVIKDKKKAEKVNQTKRAEVSKNRTIESANKDTPETDAAAKEKKEEKSKVSVNNTNWQTDYWNFYLQQYQTDKVEMTPEKIKAKERLDTLLSMKRERTPGRIKIFSSAAMKELYNLREQASAIKKKQPHKSLLVYENDKNIKYPSLNLGSAVRQKVPVYSFPEKKNETVRDERSQFQQKQSDNGSLIVYHKKASQIDPIKDDFFYTGTLPREFSIRCKILTKFDALRIYTFEFFQTKSKKGIVPIRLGVSQSLTDGSILHIKAQLNGEKHIVNLFNYLHSLSDFCNSNFLKEPPKEFFYVEFVKTKKSFAVFINDILMINLTKEFDFDSIDFTLNPLIKDSVATMEIYDIAPNAKWPSARRYKTPDQVKSK